MYTRAVVFVSRMQNLKSEADTMPWADKGNDGSFFYVAPRPGGRGNPADPLPGYGGMTAAEFVDAAGVKHDWRAEITRALVNRQKRDGSWGNDFATWMGGDPILCTGYALRTLAVCRAAAK